jgi:hypothetical protein
MEMQIYAVLLYEISENYPVSEGCQLPAAFTESVVAQL